MPEPSYLPLIEQLATLDPAVFVFGGFAEDALLDGAVTRPHGDVDVLIGRATLDQQLVDLGSIGFDGFEVFFESPPGLPLVMGAESDGQSLELGVFDELEPGIPSFVLPMDGELVRIWLPADSLRHPLVAIDGVPIRTVSPLALYQLREAFLITGVFGPARDKDRAAQDRLRRELLADIPEADLQPRIRPA